jgi:shikimate dehydrogenase
MPLIDAKTKVCALIGDPVEHSFSPLIHNAGFEALGINFIYVAFPVKDLESAIKGIRALNIRGVSITIPHKIKAIKYVDKLDKIASKIGSINTIVNDNSSLIGYNSDGIGALKVFQDRKVELTGKSILILGSGGVARAIAFSLLMNATIKNLRILGIVEEEIDTLVSDLSQLNVAKVEGRLLNERILSESIAEAEILINCTPIGMYPRISESPVPVEFFKPQLIVFDVVYNPPQTKLLKEAAQAGCQAISGLEMFINQAVIQFELWTGEKAPVAVMERVLLEQLKL